MTRFNSACRNASRSSITARQIGIEIPHKLHTRLRCFRREEIQQIVDLVVQIRRLQMQPPHLGVLRKSSNRDCSRPHSRRTTSTALQRTPTHRRFQLGQSSANSSMLSRMVDSGFLISCASPPASLAISVYWSPIFKPLDRSRGVVRRAVPLSVAESPYASLYSRARFARFRTPGPVGRTMLPPARRCPRSTPSRESQPCG